MKICNWIAAAVLLLNAETANANITVNSPITFGSEFTTSTGAVVHIGNGSITNVQLQNSTITINGSSTPLGGSVSVGSCSGGSNGGILFWTSGNCSSDPAHLGWDVTNGNMTVVGNTGGLQQDHAATFIGGNQTGTHIAIKLGDTTGSLSTDALYLGVDSGNHQGLIQTNNGQPIQISPDGGTLYVNCSAAWSSPGGILTCNNLAVNSGNTTEIFLLPSGDVQQRKQPSPSAVAPGANYFKFEVVAGTNSGSCQLIALAGTSATPTTIIDNVGSGC